MSVEFVGFTFNIVVLSIVLFEVCSSFDFDNTTMREDEMTAKNESEISDKNAKLPRLRKGRGRIVNGRPVNIIHIPWQVKIEPVGCGGSILSEWFVVSAAHCFERLIRTCNSHRGTNPSSIRIIFGTDYLTYYSPYVVAEKIVNHEYYTHLSNGYDISLIKLARPIPLRNSPASTIRLATGPPPDPRACIISGFGQTSAQGQLSNQLLYGSAAIMNTERCVGDWAQQYQIITLIRQGYIFCRDRPIGQPYATRTCMGDSGGPFACLHNGRYHLQGIVSFGDTDRCVSNAFTDVTKFVSWLERKANEIMDNQRRHYGK